MSDLGPWHVQGLTAWAVATEMNDYYRLIERRGVSRIAVATEMRRTERIEGDQQHVRRLVSRNLESGVHVLLVATRSAERQDQAGKEQAT